MRKTQKWQLPAQAVTPEAVFRQRRRIVQSLGLAAIGASVPLGVQAGLLEWFGQPEPAKRRPLPYQGSRRFGIQDTLTPEEKVISHNNFYEFGTAKTDPQRYAQQLQTDPWSIEIGGEVERPGIWTVESLLQRFPLEERVYRLRCVEAWSMVIPWLGFELRRLLEQVRPTGRARYVAFQTLYDPDQMRGQRSRGIGGGIDYPYVEGLRLDEAMHPLTILSLGLYGKTLPPQNGAPVRLVVPWKYGFKSIKSIVRIDLTERRPPTTWNQLASHEYGFYANVNPAVDHPRWSQASERRIDEGGLLAARRIATLPFNGYGEWVEGLYQGMDLRRDY